MTRCLCDDNLFGSEAEASFRYLPDEPHVCVDWPALMELDEIGLEKNAFPPDCQVVIG
jgi:hypothetical protein